MSTTSSIKSAVRQRDGQKCVQCGMTSDAHLERYGTALQVHRLVRGTRYSLDGCVTLCIPCHHKQDHSRPHAGETPLVVTMKLTEDEYGALKAAAIDDCRPVAIFARLLVMAGLRRRR